MAEYRRPTIADRENEYQKKRRMMPGMISPERLDYFADGKYEFHSLLLSVFQRKSHTSVFFSSMSRGLV